MIAQSNSIIQKSQLEGANRLDAEYYQPELLAAAEEIRGLKTVEVGHFCRIADGDHSKIPGFVETGGVRYLRAKDLQNFFIDDSDPVYVSKPYFEKLSRSHIRPLDIVLSVMGTVGNLAVVLSSSQAMTANRAVSIISPKNQNIVNSYFLAVYLESRYGTAQRERESMGGVQERVNLDDLARIKVPLLPMSQQWVVAKIFNKAVDSNLESQKLYRQAEDVLLEEVRLKDFKVPEDLTFIISYSDTKNAGRIDADYFRPKYDEILKKIKGPTKTLGELSTFLNHAKQPPYVDDGEVLILTQRHLGDSVPNLEGLDDDETKYTNKEWIEDNPKYWLKKGDVLYYSVGAYIGKTNTVLEDLNATAASFLTIIRTKQDLDPIYLTVVLNSVVGKLQSEKWQSATAQQYIYPKDIRNFIIPVLPKEVQQKIADLVCQSHEARKKSKELLEESKRKVEEMIEKGGEK